MTSSSSSLIRGALGEKAGRHALLLHCLAAGEVMAVLQPGVQQVGTAAEEG